MKGLIKGLTLGLLLFAALQFGCGSTASTTAAAGDDAGDDTGDDAEETGTEAVAITSTGDVLASSPTIDPTNLDYSITAAEASLNASIHKSLGAKDFVSPDSSNLLRIRPNASGYGADVAQYSGGSQMGYASMSYDPDTQTFTNTISYRTDNDQFGRDFDITSSIKNLAMDDADFDGSLTITDGTSMSVITADGATQTNSFQGMTTMDSNIYQLACIWDADSGCCSYSFNDLTGSAGFSIAVDATTHAKTFTDNADEALCDSVPDLLSEVTTLEDLSGDQIWDGQDGDDGTTYDVTALDTSELEDLGGDFCVTGIDSYDDFSGDPVETCAIDFSDMSPLTGSQAGCLGNVLYGNTIQGSRFPNRMFMCKILGVGNGIADGNANFAGMEFTAGSTLYIELAGFGGDFGGPGDDQQMDIAGNYDVQGDNSCLEADVFIVDGSEEAGFTVAPGDSPLETTTLTITDSVWSFLPDGEGGVTCSGDTEALFMGEFSGDCEAPMDCSFAYIKTE